MVLEICMQIHYVVFASSRLINKQKYAKTINLLCAGNKILVTYQAQGWVLSPTSSLAYALGSGRSNIYLKSLKPRAGPSRCRAQCKT